MKKQLSFLLCLMFAVCVPVVAEETADTNMQILLDKVHADKKLLVAANMGLNEEQGEAFWPLYDGYQTELQTINKRMMAAIASYAEAWNNDSLSDEKAKSLMDEVLSIEEAEVELRKKYATKLSGALPGRLVARYLQIERKIRSAINFELAEDIPLMQ